ncbi:hypothetical protein EDB19DRAFT_1837096 [Suillus lakei]|nr:hypothetical protein EDB19DRAFT_1837096 [Suillus lakei]
MSWNASVLSSVSSDTEPTVVITFDSAKYILNSRGNWKKTRGAFLTSVGAQVASGLPGLLMTFADSGHSVNPIKIPTSCLPGCRGFRQSKYHQRACFWPHPDERIHSGSLSSFRRLSRTNKRPFISHLHAGQLNIIPWLVIESHEFYRLFAPLKRRLDKQILIHSTAGEFLHVVKTLMAKLKYSQVAKRLRCTKSIPPGLVGHLQQEHETGHGSMSSSRWAVDDPDDMGLDVKGHRFSSNNAPVMYNLVCQALGRHIHIN